MPARFGFCQEALTHYEQVTNILILLKNEAEISNLSFWQELHTLFHLEYYVICISVICRLQFFSSKMQQWKEHFWF